MAPRQRTNTFLSLFLRLAQEYRSDAGVPVPFWMGAWQDLFGMDVPPWGESATPVSARVTQTELDAAQAFYRTYAAKAEEDGDVFATKAGDNHKVGRMVCQDWLSRKLQVWGMNKFIDEHLAAVNLSPYEVVTEDWGVSESIARYRMRE